MDFELPDGSPLPLPDGATGADAAAAIGPGLARAALAVKVDGQLRDLARPLIDPNGGDGADGDGHQPDENPSPHPSSVKPAAHPALATVCRPGRLAQLGERRLDKAEVAGSSPASST